MLLVPAESMNSDFLPEPTDFARRFGGLARLYGNEGAQRISRAHIIVVGVGGVGSWAAEAMPMQILPSVIGHSDKR